jgi:hypothetical protein
MFASISGGLLVITAGILAFKKINAASKIIASTDKVN